MGFLAPKLPRRFDVLMWHLGPRTERITRLIKHWAEHGSGIPSSMYLFYVAKLAGYVFGGLCFVQRTPGIGTLSQIADWWHEPVVFQKVVVWTLLFEVLGLGCGAGPLTGRFLPPFGGFLYWLRPGTIRQPPWNGRVPLTRGTRRGLVDVLLYAALIAAAVWPLLSPATHIDTGSFGAASRLEPVVLIPLAVLVPLIGLRDKTIFLAARAEHLWVALLILFLPFVDMIVLLKVLTVLVWMGAAASKLTRMYPFSVSVLISNSPMVPTALKRRLYRRFPSDIRPSRLTKGISYAGAFVELVPPAVLLASTNQSVTVIAALVMLGFHLSVMLSLPVAVALEWNAFQMLSAVFLFGAHVDLNLPSIQHGWLLPLFLIPALTMICWGHRRPDQVSFLLSMRYYSGNWASSIWAMTPSALEKIDKHVVKYGGFAKSQLRTIYGEHVAEVLNHQIFVFRAMQVHGRGLFALLPLAAGEEHEERFVLEGELVAASLVGWNFGEGHLSGEQLVAALRERCRFEPGELRVAVLEARPIHSDEQRYVLVDGATGEFDRGHVLVSDMLRHQPWEVDRLPIHSDGPSRHGRHSAPEPDVAPPRPVEGYALRAED